MVARVVNVNPSTYAPSPLHAPDRNWHEGNCYTDLWIAVLHCLGLEPRACLGSTLSCSYSADQWTFFKPALTDLYHLYGVVTEEMTVWRSVLAHCETHIAAGQLPLVEVDAFYLPDTAQTDYQQQHTKTTIAVNAVDANAQTLEYFHNAGYFELTGTDFDGIFRLSEKTGVNYLPPYCETVKLSQLIKRPDTELKLLAREMAAKHCKSKPLGNAMTAFAQSLEQTVPQLIEHDEDYFHAWVFASLRQLGAGFELAAIHLRWLADEKEIGIHDAAHHFEAVADTAKMLVMKTARIAMSGKTKSLGAPLAQMQADLEAAYTLVDRHL
ncbi:MAG: DUF1839 family protein [Pseudomonadales bacterium]